MLPTKFLKKQKCPRRDVQAGKGHSGYGFNKNTAQLSEDEDYNRRLKFIQKKATPEAGEVLKIVSSQYESAYSFPREMPWEKTPCA